jgi:hypothetical protein
MARWLREAAIERLSRGLGIPPEAFDTAGRAAPRRRNYVEREEQARLHGAKSLRPGTKLPVQRRTKVQV